MKKDFGSADLFRVVGLGRKVNPNDLKYGRFNRRMMAATIDSMALIVLLPLLERAFAVLYGPVPIDLMELQRAVNAQPTRELATSLYWNTMYASGFLEHRFLNTFFQFGVLAVLSAMCWIKWSATPGKMIMRLKIVDARTEGKMSLIQVVVRVFGYFISGICFALGFFWIAFDKKHQGWHDKLANTVVVTVPWKPFKYAKKPKGAEIEMPEENSTKPTSQAVDPSDSQAP